MFETGEAITLWRNACMFVAFLAAGRIAWLGYRRYTADPVWQGVAVGGLLLVCAYAGIFGTTLFGDSFLNLTHRAYAVPEDYMYLLKTGTLIAVLGAFAVGKKLST